jgi:hypothetical protein
MELKKYNTKLYDLLHLTVNMPENQQEVLLAYAKKIANKRAIERYTCLIYANYEIENEYDGGFILDINSHGAYIETNTEYEVGNFIILTFNNPFTCQNLSLLGEITRSIGAGVGIKFNSFFPTETEFNNFITELYGRRDLEIQYSSFFEKLFAKLNPVFGQLLSF